jgi:hypothetical protein
MTNFTTLCSQAKSARFLVPSILVRMAATGFLPSTAHACMRQRETPRRVWQFEHFLLNASLLISATTLHILALETILSVSKLGGQRRFGLI